MVFSDNEAMVMDILQQWLPTIAALGEFIVIVFFLADIRSDLKILRRLPGVIEKIQQEIHSMDIRIAENSLEIKNIKEDCVVDKRAS